MDEISTKRLGHAYGGNLFQTTRERLSALYNKCSNCCALLELLFLFCLVCDGNTVAVRFRCKGLSRSDVFNPCFIVFSWLWTHQQPVRNRNPFRKTDPTWYLHTKPMSNCVFYECVVLPIKIELWEVSLWLKARPSVWNVWREPRRCNTIVECLCWVLQPDLAWFMN